ncbi:MAG: glycoside hydrolase family 31 protein [bacterium]|nr:glycoside hydrolase family 31 protein [bacterium]
MTQIAKGIQKITLGNPENHTPESFRRHRMQKEIIDQLPVSKKNDDILKRMEWQISKRGITITLPMNTQENIYGFGLQLHSMNHAGRRRYIKVNSDPAADTGEGHAPIPFYISTAGYGIYVDTFRYTTFLAGTNAERGRSRAMTEENMPHEEFSESALYSLKKATEERRMVIDIPSADGVTFYLFEGTIMEIVQRYNLFSGGGCLPPMWGFGVWYRMYGGSCERDVRNFAAMFRKEQMPIDVLGLEPGWHSHSYSCTYKWSHLFPNPDKLVEDMKKAGYKLNLWEHVFVYPRAPFYEELYPYSGNYEVWNGLVPDFATEEACRIFQKYHTEQFVKKGIAGFKLDECDNSDYNPSNWSFPDSTQFPSGMDGEQMHMAIGTMYQNLIFDIYKAENKRTYSQVRSSGALASPLPFVLYSDLYNHKQFIRGIVNSGFSGLLWCPEVRDCRNGDDLLRRLQTVIFSSHALINSWRIPNPPWKQTDIEKNLAGEEMDTAQYYTDECRKLFELRMKLLPYLYSAFVEYHKTGKPPIRALIMDYPQDSQAETIDDEYMFGESLLVCPLTYEDGTSKTIYLPEGNWHHFFTKETVKGGRYMEIQAAYHEMAVYVKDNSIIPLAAPVQHVEKDTVFELYPSIWGNGDMTFTLYEDDFETFDYEQAQSKVTIRFESGKGLKIERNGSGPHRYHFTGLT